MEYCSVNPYNDSALAKYPLASDDEVEKILNKTIHASREWKAYSVQKRAELLNKVSEYIREDTPYLAELATLEMGKPITEARHELQKCLTAFSFYGSNAATHLQPITTKLDDGRMVEQHFEPMGTVLGVFPWNFPYWQTIRSAVPVLMSGNVMLVKPAPNVPQCALALQKLFDKAGFPEGVIQTVFADEVQIAKIIADSRVQACTLTGSERAGAAVAGQAAKHIKKSVLELGGSDPFIVLPDADIEQAVKVAMTSRFQNNGQSCIAAKRFIVHANIADAFLKKLTEAMAQLKVGNPLEETTQIGPLARLDLLEKLKQQVNKSVEAGAKILWQHTEKPQQGFFYPPTVLGNITENMPAYHEELFGAVLGFYVCDDVEQMITLANTTSFGLGASIWSADAEKAKAIATRIESGQVFINSLVRSDARFPFGGIKKSGFGRELGEAGLKEFTYVKTLWYY